MSNQTLTLQHIWLEKSISNNEKKKNDLMWRGKSQISNELQAKSWQKSLKKIINKIWNALTTTKRFPYIIVVITIKIKS